MLTILLFILLLYPLDLLLFPFVFSAATNRYTQILYFFFSKIQIQNDDGFF